MKMIPLHIADQAVAACDAEIAKLRKENARLKAFSEEAQAHIAKEERKSRERLDMEQAETARLKAEVERLTAGGYHRNFDFSVEHLTRLFKDGRIAEASYEGERSQWYCADAYARCVRAEIEAKRLKAEVERLTKAGDAMAEICNLHGHVIAIQKWGAAKENPPHA